MYVSLDLGLKHVGIAISKSHIIATPYKVLHIEANLLQELIHELKDLNKQRRIIKVYYGVPKHMDGKDSELSLKFSKIITEIRPLFKDVEFISVDERLSSKNSSIKKKHGKRNDDIVAAELLTTQLSKN